MKAAQLIRAAAVLDAVHGGQNLDVIAADMRAEAQAANGYSNVATLDLSIVIDNDHDLYDQRRALVRATLEDHGEAHASFVADALREWCEEIAGLEGDVELPPLAAAMTRTALTDVDWIELAKHYIEEPG